MSSISKWPRARMQAIESRSCCSLPRMMRLSCAIVAPTSSIGSAWVIRVGTASMSLCPTLRYQRSDCLLLLHDLGDLPFEGGDSRMHFGDDFRRRAFDELAVAQLLPLPVEILGDLRLALL